LISIAIDYIYLLDSSIY